MLEDILRSIAKVDFKGELLETTKQLYEIERPFGFGAFERSARFCFEKLEQAGAEEVELVEFPADGRTSYWDKRLPLAWYPESGKLEVTGPRRAFQDPVIADHSRDPFHLAMWCASTPAGGIESEIVTENMMLAGHSVKGRLVLAGPHHFPKAIYRTVCDRGGIGIVSDFVKDPFVTPDGLFWVNSFGETPEWYHGADNRDLLGFCVSPRVGRRLRELLVHGTVKVHAEVRARKEPGKLYAATGIIRGSDIPQEEIWLAAHLFEPLGTDNSTGAASTMAIAQVLTELVNRGELRRPRRSIRFAMTLELYGFTALLKTLHERGRKLAATFVLDGTTFKQSVSHLPTALHLSPDVNPLFSHGPIKRAVELCLEPSSEVWRLLNAGHGASERVEYGYRPGYLGNDAFLGDPLLAGPSFHLHTSGGPYWHNSENTLDMVWPELLNAMTALHAGLAYYLSSLGPQDAAALTDLVEAEGLEYLSDARTQSLEGSQKPEDFAKAVHFRVDMVRKRLENVRAWTGQGAPVERALQEVKSFAQDLLAKAGAEDVDTSDYAADELGKVDRRALTVIFQRKEPTFPMSQVFVEDPRDRRELSGGMSNVLARMDGQKHLLRILEEEEYFAGRPLNRRKALGDCLFLARHGYLDVTFTEVVTKDELVEGIRRSGVQQGDLIFAHSSLSAFGHMPGGAETFVDALLEAVGPDGTVLVPAFTGGTIYGEGILPRRRDVQPYHPGLTRGWTGVVPRTFLKRAGVVRSAHPSHSVAGLGPLAEKCLKDQRLDDPPAGLTSAFPGLVEFGGKIVYLGAPLAVSTFLHYLEAKLDLPYLTDALCCVRDERGEMDIVYNKQHVLGHRDFYTGDWRDTKTFRALIDAGLEIKRSEVGLGEIHTIDAREFEQKGLEAIGKDPEILLCDRPDCLFCQQAREQL